MEIKKANIIEYSAINERKRIEEYTEIISKLYYVVESLEAENKKLRECLDFIGNLTKKDDQ